MLTSAMPVLPLRTAATPTIAQSCARRLNFWNDHPAPGTFGHADLGEQLVGGERRLEEAGEEVAGRDRALALARPRHERAAQGEHHRGKVGGGIGVRERTADRAPMAHLRVADLAGGVGEERHLLLEQVRGLDVAVASQRADRDVVAAVADVGQVLQPADVDQHRRATPAAASSAAAASGHRRESWRRRRVATATTRPRRPTRPASSRTQRESLRTSGFGGFDGGPDPHRRCRHLDVGHGAVSTVVMRRLAGRRPRARPSRCCGSRCSGRGCPRAPAAPRPRWAWGSPRAATTAAMTMPGVQ